MPLTCDYCGRPADWRRPPTKTLRNEGYRCDTHAPDWRIAEYEALTLVAKQRKEGKDAADLPKPAMAPEKEEAKTPAKPKMPPRNLTRAEANALIDRAVARAAKERTATKAAPKGRRK